MHEAIRQMNKLWFKSYKQNPTDDVTSTNNPRALAVFLDSQSVFILFKIVTYPMADGNLVMLCSSDSAT